MLARFYPAGGVYTAVARGGDDGQPQIGQISHVPGERSAHLSFLLIQEPFDERAACALLENLVVQAGEWGAANVLAAVDEAQSVFTSLRRAGFAVYSRQDVWRMPALQHDDRVQNEYEWQEATPLDCEPVLHLCQSLLPPLVQRAEEAFSYCPKGLVVRSKDEVLAYVQVTSGPRGICLLPLFHPQVTDIRPLLLDLAGRLKNMVLSPLERPVYYLVRSYQAGLSGILEDLGAEKMGAHALLVKHIAIRHRKPVQDMQFSSIDRRAHPTSPMVHQINSPKKMD
jgi:hypothetical protein